MVEQAVAAGQQDGVDVGLADEAGEEPGLVHADADRAHDSFRAQCLQRGIRLGQRLLGVVVRIVQVDDVDPVQAQPLQAGLQAPAYAVRAEVPDPLVGGGDGEAVGQVVAGGLRPGTEQSADLGGQDVLVPGQTAQSGAEAPFGQAEAVVRGGVEVPYAGFPGGQDGPFGLGVADRGEEVPDPGGAEGEFADAQCAAAEWVVASAHDFGSGRRRRPAIPPSTASAVPVTEEAEGEAR